MIGAGLAKAVELDLKVKPWVKTSLAPGSQVMNYLEKTGLNIYLDKLGFNLVGYGCTTCIGNSGPLADNIIEAIQKEIFMVYQFYQEIETLRSYFTSYKSELFSITTFSCGLRFSRPYGI